MVLWDVLNVMLLIALFGPLVVLSFVKERSAKLEQVSFFVAGITIVVWTVLVNLAVIEKPTFLLPLPALFSKVPALSLLMLWMLAFIYIVQAMDVKDNPT